MNKVDIWSKGEVMSYLQVLLKEGQIQPCENLIVKRGAWNAFYPQCVKNLASRKHANNVFTISTGYRAPSSYHWPACPENCPRFKRAENFIESLIGEDTMETSNKIFNHSEDKIYPKDVFIVHGHDTENLLELRNLLKEKYQLNPIILSERPGKSRTLIKKLEEEARTSNYAFILITPDDIIRDKTGEYSQPRPNVIFELGWFCGRIGRGRTCILYKKGTKIPTDIDGVSRIEFKDSIKEKLEEIERELKAAELIKIT